MGTLSWIIIAIIILTAIYFISKSISKSDEEQQKLFAKIAQDCKREGQERAHRHKANFKEKYSDLGEPTVEICFHKQIWEDNGLISRAQYYEYGWTFNSITIWQNKKKFLLSYEGNRCASLQEPLSFDSLISCEVTDDVVITHGNGQSTTKKSKLGMITRGIVGGTLLGGAGAAIGALSANSTTETSFSPDVVRHDYKIHITLNDFSCPMITLEFGQGEQQMRQVLSMLNLIIKNSQ